MANTTSGYVTIDFKKRKVNYYTTGTMTWTHLPDVEKAVADNFKDGRNKPFVIANLVCDSGSGGSTVEYTDFALFMNEGDPSVGYLPDGTQMWVKVGTEIIIAGASTSYADAIKNEKKDGK